MVISNYKMYKPLGNNDAVNILLMQQKIISDIEMHRNNRLKKLITMSQEKKKNQKLFHTQNLVSISLKN